MRYQILHILVWKQIKNVISSHGIKGHPKVCLGQDSYHGVKIGFCIKGIIPSSSGTFTSLQSWAPNKGSQALSCQASRAQSNFKFGWTSVPIHKLKLLFLDYFNQKNLILRVCQVNYVVKNRNLDFLG